MRASLKKLALEKKRPMKGQGIEGESWENEFGRFDADGDDEGLYFVRRETRSRELQFELIEYGGVEAKKCPRCIQQDF